MPEPSFHGERNGGEPEWPPSPLRLLQAIVAAAGNRWRQQQFQDDALPALGWFETLHVADILAPQHRFGSAYRIAVPDNDLDDWARPIARGNEPKNQPEQLKSMKQVRPTHLVGESPTVHYLYPLADGNCPHFDILQAAARSITHLGWGVDMVVGDAQLLSTKQAEELPGERWRVVPSGGVPLRVPKAGTLQQLMQKHEAFLNRLSSEGFKPVPPLSCFDVQHYYCPTAKVPAAKPLFAAFALHRTLAEQEETPRTTPFRPFHHIRRVATVAGLVRHSVATVGANLYAPEWVNEHIHGHGCEENSQAKTDDRLQFLPLPSLTPIGVGGIRRVLLVGFPGCPHWDVLTRRLNGEELIDK
ncbi:MAG: type I-G CRISPR-associated protein Csb2, partial [Gemmataceae bacterium]